MTNDLIPRGTGSAPTRASRAREGIPARLPDVLGTLTDELRRRVRGYPAATGLGLTEDEVNLASDCAGYIAGICSEVVTPALIGEWAALVMAGTRKPRTDHETQLFMVALAFACEDMPAAAFCEETQRMAMRRLVFAPSVSEIMEILDPIVNDWQRTREALLAFVEQSAAADYAATRDTPPAFGLNDGA